jgi:hypothetical protein
MNLEAREPCFFSMRHCHFLLLLSLFSLGLSAQAATQTVVLKPGWNSVWLDVAPADPAPAAVFAGVPILQAWCYFPKERPVEFIENPESGLWNRDAWNVFIPSGPQAFLTNLYAVQADRPYLIKLDGMEEVTLTITGEAAYRPLQWRPRSFNLVGFPVDPGVGGGGAGSFFFHDEALKNGAKFKLNSAGQWTAMLPSDVIRRGEAYWIYANAATAFNGPLAVSGDTGFGLVRERATVKIQNTSFWPFSVHVQVSGGFPLVRKTFDALGKVVWSPLESLHPTLAAGETLTLDLGVQRQGVTTRLDEVLTITGGGSRIELPLNVATPAVVTQGGGGMAGASDSMAVNSAAMPQSGLHTGLWVGHATLRQVEEINASPPALRATPAEMSFRVILHVDAGGQVRLLKSVTTLWKEGVASPGPGIPEIPGQHVLVTDDTRIPDFKSATLRDGRPFSYRISSIGYDHPGNEHAVTGIFGDSLSTQLVIAKDSPTHPYRHKFHPDHDGLDPQYQPLPAGITADQEESWAITRAWQFTFEPETDDGSPGSGYDRVSGLFQETLSGMTRVPILMKGTFELRRVTFLAELNPSL